MDKLNILWTTDNKDTAMNMIVMYATNSKIKGWWQHVNVIIWGASAGLVANDIQIQAEIIDMIHQGVTIEACKACSDNLGVTDHLVKLGINVRYMGQPMTEYLKADEKILTI